MKQATMKNIVFGFHLGEPHDRKDKISVCAFTYGKTSFSFSGTSIFEKKSSYRDEGFIVRLKAPVASARMFFWAGDGDVGRGVFTTIKDYAYSMGFHLRYGRKR